MIGNKLTHLSVRAGSPNGYAIDDFLPSLASAKVVDMRCIYGAGADTIHINLVLSQFLGLGHTL